VFSIPGSIIEVVGPASLVFRQRISEEILSRSTTSYRYNSRISRIVCSPCCTMKLDHILTTVIHCITVCCVYTSPLKPVKLCNWSTYDCSVVSTRQWLHQSGHFVLDEGKVKVCIPREFTSVDHVGKSSQFNTWIIHRAY